jgi:hypothetical protein
MKAGRPNEFRKNIGVASNSNANRMKFLIEGILPRSATTGILDGFRAEDMAARGCDQSAIIESLVRITEND